MRFLRDSWLQGFPLISRPPFSGPTPSINDLVQYFSDRSYERHTYPVQYNTYRNHHGYAITIPPNFLLRYIPRRLVWWVAVHITPTTIIHVITIFLVIILGVPVFSSYRDDPQRLGTIRKSSFSRPIETNGCVTISSPGPRENVPSF